MKQLPIEHLLLDLKANDIKIWLEGDRLRVSTPKGGLSSKQQDELRLRKAELLKFLQNAERVVADEQVIPIVAVSRDTDLLLSFDQRRMWFLHQLNPENCAYNLQTVTLLKVSPELLQKALNEINSRHEVLRTRYCMKDGVPLQVISLPLHMEFPLADLSALTGNDVWKEIKRKAGDAAGTPFDLENGPVWRAHVFKLDKGITGLVLTIHHIASDGWSLNSLINEILVLCIAWENASPPVLENMSVQYADYAQWQRQYLQGDILKTQLEYWHAQLAGMPELLELPIDFKRPAVQTSNGAVLGIDLPKDIIDGVQLLAKQHQATLFMTMLAVFKILLFRYTTQTDIVVGTPIAGRERQDVKNVQGLFLNNLVMRTDASANPTFVEFLQRVRQVTLGAYSHSSLPFETLVEHLQPKRNLSHNPLFQVVFNQMIMSPTSDIFRQLGIDNEAGSLAEMKSYAQLDLNVLLQVKPDGTSMVFNYSTDLFERATIQRMAGHYQNLLASVLKNPQQGIADLALMQADERQQILHAWNNTEQAFAEHATGRLFEAQVAQSPEKTALIFKHQRVSYAELNSQANQLARHLINHGVTADVRVGVCVERGVDMLVSILAIHKAGGAYVPLDPAYPKDRLAYMLEDSTAAIIITQQHLSNVLPAHQSAVIDLDADRAGIMQLSERNLDTAPGMSDLAYIIYTSGSTGQPKGVAIEHRALMNLLNAMAQTPGLQRDDVFCAVTTLSFDIHAAELFLPLICGASIVLASREVAADAIELARLLGHERVTTMQATPATWRMLVSTGWQGSAQLSIWSGGEALSRELADQLLARSKTVWNCYGPTETTVWSTVYKIEAGHAPVLIGYPLANTHVYIVDPYLQPVPAGIAGELLIGGDGVARGYWNKPKLSAERFIADPFVKGAGQRVYRTGDLVKRHADGNIEYLARIDNQVKLRGFRIELGEIEAVLMRQPKIQDAVAIVREDVPGDQRLVAYLITKANESSDEADLRKALAAFLPAYMVPSLIVFVAAFPLTPSGKVDRKALPAPAAKSRRRDEFIAPQTDIEKTLAAIWCEVLNLERVSLDDNFFNIGGHSLLAIQALSKMQRQLTVKLTLGRFFELATIAALTAHIDSLTDALTDAHPSDGEDSIEIEI